MKLNKVLALALSGVMAVSMLAGCSGKSENGDKDDNTEVVVPASNAVSVMNDAQDMVKFKSSADLDAALAAAAKKVTLTEIENLDFTVKEVSTGNVYNELKNNVPVGEMVGGVIFDNSTNAVAGKSITKTALYYVESEGLTEKAALEQIANVMKSKDEYYPELVWIGSPKANYEASYTGAVSVVKATASDAGKTASAYYIAISVTQSIARKNLNVK